MKKQEAEKNIKTSAQHADIVKWLKSVKFKRKAFGGVDEADVWQKIDELNLLYEKILLEKQAQESPVPAESTKTEDGDE